MYKISNHKNNFGRIINIVSSLFLCGGLLFISPNSIAFEQKKEEKIILVADEWCPFTCKDTAKKQGILVDIAKEVFSRYGITVEYKAMPWARAISDTRTGKYTAILGAAIDEAPDFIYPAVPQATFHPVFYTLKSNGWVYDHNEDNEGQFKNVAIGGVLDYSYNREVDAYINKHKLDPARVQLVYGENAIEANVKKLLAKRIDVLLDEDLVIRKYLAEHNLTDKIHIAGALREDISSHLFISFSPTNPSAKKYARILDKEMLDMIYSGKITEIVNEYNIK